MNHWFNGSGRYMYWGGPGFNIGSILFNILFWGAVIFIIIILFSHFAGHDHEPAEEEPETGDEKYLDIVKERYARGEITKKEYDQLKKDFE